MTIGGSGSGKTMALINLINQQKDIDKIYFYARDLKLNMNIWLKKVKMQDAGLKHVNNPNAFIKCSNAMDGASENYNPNRKRKTLIVFDDMIADIVTWQIKNFKP